jgi:hypothetical protein
MTEPTETVVKARPKCPVCSVDFSRQAGVTRHMQRVHPGQTLTMQEPPEFEVVESSIVEKPQPADSVNQGDTLLLLDGTQREITRKIALIPGTTITLYFGPNYWITMPAWAPVRKVAK